MTNTMTSLGGNLYARKEGAPGEYLTLFGPLGQVGKIPLSDQQAWELLQLLLEDIERLATTQPAATLEGEHEQIIALLRVYKALEHRDQSVEDLAWAGDLDATRASVQAGSEAAEQIRREVDSWEEPILNLILAVDEATQLQVATEGAEAEQKTSQGESYQDFWTHTILKNALDERGPDEP
jgi:hypothetical protein